MLIPKKKDKYRPICLLNACGKLYEQLIKIRLEKDLDEHGGLSDRQFGFQRGLSTTDAIMEVTKLARFANSGTWGKRSSKDLCALTMLDVRNAFNSAK